MDGTNYSGWQYQTPDINTIQLQLTHALKIIAKKRIVITGSSRTDAGVHSAGLTANFFLPINIEDISLLKALNSLLPPDIRIALCERVDNSFNARFMALSKTYVYRLFFGQIQSPFLSRYTAHIPYPLNLRIMRKAVKSFIGEKDFSSFTSDDPGKKRIRTISQFSMRMRNEEIIFTISGKSFLRYMVRNIIGTLIDIGRGKIKYSDLEKIFSARDRTKAGRTAPAKGLILFKVEY